jgi:hypothetical protein
VADSSSGSVEHTIVVAVSVSVHAIMACQPTEYVPYVMLRQWPWLLPVHDLLMIGAL